MQVFFTKQIDGNHAILDEEESRHLIRVLRLKQDDPVDIVDGRGNLFKGVISLPDSRNTMIRITETKREHLARKYSLHLAIAPTKSTDRFEWFLEKATEIGIDEITPVICDHSERKAINFNRLNKIIISAMKQSLKAYLPKLNNAVRYTDFISSDFEGNKFIAHYSETITTNLQKAYNTGDNALILIGPEGDFSQSELTLAVKNAYFPVNMGKNRLRTETAALVACLTINLLNE